MSRFERFATSIFSTVFGLALLSSSTWQLPIYTDLAAQQQAATANKRFFYQHSTVPWNGLYISGGTLLLIYGIAGFWIATKPKNSEPVTEATPQPEAAPAVIQTEVAVPAPVVTTVAAPLEPTPIPVAAPVAPLVRRAPLRRVVPAAHTAPVAPPTPVQEPVVEVTVPQAPAYAAVTAEATEDRLGKPPMQANGFFLNVQPLETPFNEEKLQIQDFSSEKPIDSYDEEEGLVPERIFLEPPRADTELLELEPFMTEHHLALSKVNADFLGDLSDQTSDEVFLAYEAPHLARQMGKAGKSIILSAQSRAGKTSFWKTVMLCLEQQKPCDWHIVNQKNRTWLGLEQKPDVVVVPTIPNKYLVFAKRVALVHHLLEQRTLLTKEEIALAKTIYLVLDDYHSLIEQAKIYLEPNRYSRLLASLSYIVTMGAEFDVFAVFLTQSHGIKSLKWADQNTRTSLVFLSLGRVVFDKDGDPKGSYSSVSDAIGDNNLIASGAIRQRLAQQYAVLQPYAERNSRSIGFTTLGGERLFLLPFIDEEALPLLYPPQADSFVEELEPVEAPVLESESEVATIAPEPELQREIWLLSQRFAEQGRNYGWITARDFRQNAPGYIRNRCTADELRFEFVHLARTHGSTDGEGSGLRYHH